MIELVFRDKMLGKMVHKYVSALEEEGRFPRKGELIVTDDEILFHENRGKRVLLMTDKADPATFSPRVVLPCRREDLAEAILHCLTS